MIWIQKEKIGLLIWNPLIGPYGQYLNLIGRSMFTLNFPNTFYKTLNFFMIC